MTCSDMGGPCGASMTALTAEEMINMGAHHVMSTDDDAHRAVAAQMQTMTLEGKEAWQADFTKKWDELAENATI